MRLIDADALGLTDMEIIMCNGDYKEAMKMLIDKIEHALTIEERKTGKWLEKDEFTVECSICKSEWLYETHYCPHCGARMEVGT